MDVEFKLFAGLTVKQFAGLAMWLFFALFLYLLNLPPLIGYPLILLAVFLGLAFAFMRIQNQPFSTWLTNFILAMIKPQRKVWKKSPTPPKALV
ncbi:PrgI family protein, partial [Candidatus Dojkabacteria bacterium]|nr:PrgI family protein [Candidatus Dojkabacteria bacterium]